MADGGCGLAWDGLGSWNKCARAAVRVGSGRERARLETKGVEKSTRSDIRGQKISPVKEGGSRSRAARVASCGCCFRSRTSGVRAAPFRPPGAAPGAVSAALRLGGRGEGPPSPGQRGAWGCRWRDRQGEGWPVGVGRAVFGGRCAFGFVLILSEVALSSGDPARRSRGSSSNTCKGMASACRAAASGCAGRWAS